MERERERMIEQETIGEAESKLVRKREREKKSESV